MAGVGGFAALVVLSSVLQPAGPPAAQAQAAPTATNTSTTTATATVTSTPTSTSTSTPSATVTSTPTQSPTPTSTQTSTATRTATPSPTTTAASSPTSTVASSPSATPTSQGGGTGQGSCGRVTGSPDTRWQNAFDCMASVQTARVSSSQRITQGGQVKDITSAVTLVRGNADITESRAVSASAAATPSPTPRSNGNGRGNTPPPAAVATPGATNRRRVDVGSNRYEKEDGGGRAGAPPGWERKNRTAPTGSQATAFGPLTLADGTSLGAVTLYTRVRETGVEHLAGVPGNGNAHVLVGEFNMTALAAAGRVTGTEAARVGLGSATLSVWVGQEDGLIYKTTLSMTLPSGGTGQPSTVHESTVEISQHNASLSVVAP
jgi:hypothetical protein